MESEKIANGKTSKTHCANAVVPHSEHIPTHIRANVTRREKNVKCKKKSVNSTTDACIRPTF